MAEALQELDAQDAQAWLDLPAEVRLERLVANCGSVAAQAPDLPGPAWDDEAETWFRVNQRLATLT